MLYANLWKFWFERNNRAFINKSKSMEKIVWPVSEWVYTRKEFEHAGLEDLNRSWVANFKREEGKRGRGRVAGWCTKFLHRLSWERTPMGILKLKLDGSFVQSISRGIGGVIREWEWQCC